MPWKRISSSRYGKNYRSEAKKEHLPNGGTPESSEDLADSEQGDEAVQDSDGPESNTPPG